MPSLVLRLNPGLNIKNHAVMLGSLPRARIYVKEIRVRNNASFPRVAKVSSKAPYFPLTSKVKMCDGTTKKWEETSTEESIICMKSDNMNIMSSGGSTFSCCDLIMYLHLECINFEFARIIFMGADGIMEETLTMTSNHLLFKAKDASNPPSVFSYDTSTDVTPEELQVGDWIYIIDDSLQSIPTQVTSIKTVEDFGIITGLPEDGAAFIVDDVVVSPFIAYLESPEISPPGIHHDLN